jgi:DNA invertase Pin-like site-specific DNA recombinase
MRARVADYPGKPGRKRKVTPEISGQIKALLKRHSTRQVAYRLGLSQCTVWMYSKS